MKIRICCGCKKSFPLTKKYFHKHKYGGDGFRYLCKRCNNLASKNWYYLPRGKYLSYKKDALRRNIKWNLSFEEFNQFWQKPCYYCKTKIKTIGLDRVNNQEGYIKNNIVPCCMGCNRAKSYLSKECFINICKRVALYH